MKKSITGVALASVMALGFAGCGGAAATPAPAAQNFDKCMEKGEEAPSWVCIPEVAGGVAAIGSAEVSPAGSSFQRQEAMANGRDALARAISVKVQNMFKNFTQVTGVGDAATVEKLSSNVSKQIANQTLNGSQQKGRWIAKDGTMYVLVVLDPTAMVEATKATVKTSLKNDEALWQQFQAKKAEDSLDAEIAKEMGQPAR
ncbi:MAG: hypothetical protein KU37_08055 [Sulfuricurvum sp. PC08-66]|nr:MAG: hypothetical protein KU37_08055 [Sulfuricurvum sp. PC08-66]